MRRNIKLAVFFSFSLFVSGVTTAQDSDVRVHTWKAESKKIVERKFELIFSTPVSADWQIYAPNQVLLDVKTTELNFSDSAVRQEGDFVIDPAQIKEEASSIFENTKVKLLPGDVLWKAIIHIEGTVPAKLQGTLLYTYGRKDEFFPATFLPFSVS